MIIQIEKTFFKGFYRFLENEGLPYSIREDADMFIYDLADIPERYTKRRTKSFLKKYLLPAYAIYKALLETELKEDEVLDLLDRYFARYDSSEAVGHSFSGGMGRTFHAYDSTVFSEMRKREEGWEKIWLYNTKKESACNITKCFIYEICKELDALPLATVFCKQDYALLKKMNGSGNFSRNHAIGLGDDFCDFVFEGK